MVGAAVALAVLALVCPAPGVDAETACARGTTIFGLQAGGGAAGNVEGQRAVSDISFLNVSLEATAEGLKLAMRYHLIQVRAS